MAKTRLDQSQILQTVYDVPDDALRVKISTPLPVAFVGGANEVEIDAADGDSIMIVGTEDGSPTGTQRTARVDSQGRLITTTVFSGSITTTPEPPASDFRTVTLSVTNTATAITFSGFTIQSLSLLFPGTNTVEVKVGKADVDTNYFLAQSGLTLSLPLQASTSPVYLKLAGTGSAEVSILALGY